jgi:hypothetical protein
MVAQPGIAPCSTVGDTFITFKGYSRPFYLILGDVDNMLTLVFADNIVNEGDHRFHI